MTLLITVLIGTVLLQQYIHTILSSVINNVILVGSTLLCTMLQNNRPGRAAYPPGGVEQVIPQQQGYVLYVPLLIIAMAMNGHDTTLQAPGKRTGTK